MVSLSQLTPTQKFLLAVSLPITLIFLYFLFRKNDDEEEEIRPAGVVSSRHISVDVAVPQHAVGAVIGAQGAHIKQIQEATKARISFRGESRKDEDRTLVIRGTRDAVHQAELMVRQVIVDQPPVISDTITVPGNTIGRIIGRNGDTIRSMTRQSKAKIIIEKRDSRNEEVPVVISLSGTDAAIDTAKGLILEKVAEDKEFRERDRLKKENRPIEGAAAAAAGDNLAASCSANQTQMRPSADAGSAAGDIRASSYDGYSLVYVSAVEHPEHFWIQVLNERAPLLDSLITEMTSFYESQGEPLTEVQEGDMVAAPFDVDNMWYRAEVSRVESDKVDVYYGDFGDSCWLARDRIKQLRSDFRSLPFQAVECCLANVKPATGDEWSADAIDVFEELTYAAKWKHLMSTTIGECTDSSGSIPCVCLIDTHGPEDIDISAELVRRGHAVYVDSHQPGTTAAAAKSQKCLGDSCRPLTTDGCHRAPSSKSSSISQRTSRPEAFSRSWYQASSADPLIVQSVSVTDPDGSTMTELCATTDNSLLAAGSPTCLSMSTPTYSDQGYCSSLGLYEGSCDHLENDRDRRYSAELSDDTEVFIESTRAESILSKISSAKQDSVPEKLTEVKIGRERALDVDVITEMSFNASDETLPPEQPNSLPPSTSQDVSFPTDVADHLKSQSVEVTGLQEVAGRYAEVELMLEMNRQRTSRDPAEEFPLAAPDTVSCPDHETLASLAGNYSVINESVQWNRLMSTCGRSQDSDMPGEPSTSRPVVKGSEPPPKAPAVQDIQVGDTSDITRNGISGYLYAGDKSTMSKQHTFTSHHVGMENVHYYPAYSKLRDLETGVFSNSPHRTIDSAVSPEGELVVSSAAVNHDKSDRETDVAVLDKAARHPSDKPSDLSLVADNPNMSVQSSEAVSKTLHDTPAPVPVCKDVSQADGKLQPDLDVLHYNSLATLCDVENGKSAVKFPQTPANVVSTAVPLPADRTSLKQKSGKPKNVTEAAVVSYPAENGEIPDADHSKLDGDESDKNGFTVVKTSKHRRRKRKQNQKDSVDHDSIQSNSELLSETLHESQIAVHSKDAETEAISGAFPVDSAAGFPSDCAADELPRQNVVEEVLPDSVQLDDGLAAAEVIPTSFSEFAEVSHATFTEKEAETVADVSMPSDENVVGLMVEHVEKRISEKKPQPVAAQAEIMAEFFDLTTPANHVALETEPEKTAEEATAQISDAGKNAVDVYDMKERSTFKSLNSAELPESIEFEQNIFKIKTAVHLDEIRTEKLAVHYSGLALLADVERGKVHNRLKASRFLREWSAENVDDVVAYIVGSGAPKRRRKHQRHLKRVSESDASNVTAAESSIMVQEMMMTSKLHAKSEENISRVAQESDRLDVVMSDGEQVGEEQEDSGSEDGSFQVVESRKHRRQRQRQDAEELWMQYMDERNAAEVVADQSEMEDVTAEYLAERGPCDVDAVPQVDPDKVTDVDGAPASFSLAAERVEVSSPSFARDLEAVNESLETDLAARCGVEAHQLTADTSSGRDVTEPDAAAEVDGKHISAELHLPVDDSLLEAASKHVPVVDEIHTRPDRDVAANDLPDLAETDFVKQESRSEEVAATDADHICHDKVDEPVTKVRLLFSEIVASGTGSGIGASSGVADVCHPSSLQPVEGDIATEIAQDVAIEHSIPLTESHLADGFHSAVYPDNVQGKQDDEDSRENVSCCDGDVAMDTADEALNQSPPELTAVITQDVQAQLPSGSESREMMSASTTDTPGVSAEMVAERVGTSSEGIRGNTASETLISHEDVPLPSSESTATECSAMLPSSERDVHQISFESTAEQQLMSVIPRDGSILNQRNGHVEEHTLVPAYSDLGITQSSGETLPSCCGVSSELPEMEFDVPPLVPSSPAHSLDAPDVDTGSASKTDQSVPSSTGTFVSADNDASSSRPCLNDLSPGESDALVSDGELLGCPVETELSVSESSVQHSVDGGSLVAETGEVESATEPSLQVPVAESLLDVPTPVAICEVVAEDEEHDISFHGHCLAPVDGNYANILAGDSPTEFAEKCRDNEGGDVLKKPVVSSSNFIAETLPYYYSALFVLRDIERGVIQLQHEPTSRSLGERIVEMSAEVTKATRDDERPSMSAEYQCLPGPAVAAKSRVTQESAVDEVTAVQETARIETNQPRELAYSLPVVTNQISEQLSSDSVDVHCVDEKDLQPRSQRSLTTDAGRTHPLIHNHADIISSQCHYQSLRSLHSLETGNLQAPYSHLHGSADQISVTENVLPASSTEHFDGNSKAGSNSYDSVLIRDSPTQGHEVFKSVSSLDDSVDMTRQVEEQEPPASVNESTTLDISKLGDNQITEEDIGGFKDAPSETGGTKEPEPALSGRNVAEISTEPDAELTSEPREVELTAELTKELVPIALSSDQNEMNVTIAVNSFEPEQSLRESSPIVQDEKGSLKVSDDESDAIFTKNADKLPADPVCQELQPVDHSTAIDTAEHSSSLASPERVEVDWNCFEDRRAATELELTDANIERSPGCMTELSLPANAAAAAAANHGGKSAPMASSDDIPLHQSDVEALHPTRPTGQQYGSNVTEPACYFSECRHPNNEEIDIIPSTENGTYEHSDTSKKKKKRKKKPKSPKDDAVHQDLSLGCGVDLSPVEEINAAGESISEPTPPLMSANEVQASTLVSTETVTPPENGTSAGSGKKNKKRKRNKKPGQAVIESSGMASKDAAIANEVQLNDDSSSPEFSSPPVTELVAIQSEVAHLVVDTSDFGSRPLDDCAPTTDDTASRTQYPDQTVSAAEPVLDDTTEAQNDTRDGDYELCAAEDVSAFTAGGASASPTKNAKRRNRRKRKGKPASTETLSGHSVEDATPSENFEELALNSFVENCSEEPHSSPAAEDADLMTESLEEDTRITEEPVDISFDDQSEDMTLKPASRTGGKKKKKVKGKTYNVVSPETSVSGAKHSLAETAPTAKDDLLVKDEIVVGKVHVPSFIPESAGTDLLSGASLEVATGEQETVPELRDEERRGPEVLTRLSIHSDSESECDEYQLDGVHQPQLAAAAAGLSCKKRKKMRKRKKQKKTSQSEAAEPETDLYTLLRQIIEICATPETLHDTVVAESRDQPSVPLSKPAAGKQDAGAPQTSKSARRPRKYQRSKPIRLPDIVAEQPTSSVPDKTTGTSSTPGLNSTEVQHLEEERTHCHGTPEVPKNSATQMKIPDSIVADCSTSPPNIEQTETIVAWSMAAVSTKDTDMSIESGQTCTFSVDNVACCSQPPGKTDLLALNTDGNAVSETPDDITTSVVQETRFEDDGSQTTTELRDDVIEKTNNFNVAGCLTADVFTVVPDHKAPIDADITPNISSGWPYGGDTIQLWKHVPDNRVLDTDDSIGRILDQNSNPCWFDGELLTAPTTSGCETSSVDSEVERIFAGDAVSPTGSASLVEPGGVPYISDHGKNFDEDLTIEDADDDVLVTEYVDVEIIEETETVTVLPNKDDDDGDDGPVTSDVDQLPTTVLATTSDVSSPRVSTADTTDDFLGQFRPDETGDGHVGSSGTMPSNSKVKDDPSAGPGGPIFYPQWFGTHPAAADTFHWPQMSAGNASKVNPGVGLRLLSRKRQHPSEGTSSSDSGDDVERRQMNEQQFILAEHQPTSHLHGWPPFVDDAPWQTSAPDHHILDAAAGFADETDTSFFAEQSGIAAAGQWHGFVDADPSNFYLDESGGLNVIRSGEIGLSQDDNREFSGDSLIERGQDQPFSGEDAPVSSPRPTGKERFGGGAVSESCSTDSLDGLAKPVPRVSAAVPRPPSSTDCISEDSLAEASFAVTDHPGAIDQEPARVTKDAAVCDLNETKSVQDSEDPSPDVPTTVSAKSKKFRGVTAKFRCAKPGVPLRSGRKRKLANRTSKDDSDDDVGTDSDSVELE